MTSILIIDDTGAPAYVAGLRTAFPELAVNAVLDPSQAAPYLANVDVLIGFTTFMNDGLIRQAPKLRWIQALGAGVDNIIDLPSLRDDIVVTNVHGIHGEAMSEAAVMLMLALSRDLPRAVRNQGQHHWERWPSRLIEGKTAGLVGVGAIAATLAPRLKAFGMTVLGFSAELRLLPGFDHMYRRDELVALAPKLDYMIVLAPLTEVTRDMIGMEVLGAMKPSGFLLNLGRGGVVNERALLQALRERRIAGAALDVFEQEPLPAAHPFWDMENVIVTPHLGGKNNTYAARALPMIVENVRRFIAGDFANMVNVVRPGAAAKARGSA